MSEVEGEFSEGASVRELEKKGGGGILNSGVGWMTIIIIFGVLFAIWWVGVNYNSIDEEIDLVEQEFDLVPGDNPFCEVRIDANRFAVLRDNKARDFNLGYVYGEQATALCFSTVQLIPRCEKFGARVYPASETALNEIQNNLGRCQQDVNSGFTLCEPCLEIRAIGFACLFQDTNEAKT